MEKRIEEIKKLKEERSKLQQRLREIDREEEKDKLIKTRQQNYENFKSRPSDDIIGKAHMKSGLDGGGYYNFGSELQGYGVYVSGNCGTTYNPAVNIVSSTKTYFHNVWTHEQKSEFKKKMNDMIREEIQKVCESATCVIELMGLTSTHNYSQYPEDKIDDIKKAIQEARFEQLDKFELDELVKLRDESFSSLFHGQRILESYLEYKGIPKPVFEDDDDEVWDDDLDEVWDDDE